MVNINSLSIPIDAFSHCERDPNFKVSPHWEEIRKILGNRIAFLMYYENTYNFSNRNRLVDILMGGDGKLGLKVAKVLHMLIPDSKCKNKVDTCMIMCSEYIDFLPTSKELCYDNSNFRIVLNDDTYIVVINNFGYKIELKIYKKE